jgi:hypothetical protein
MEITPSVGGLSLSGQEPEPWITSTFAPNWYADAVAQARTELGRDGRRREIIFAVCTAESYLVEWVRDSVLNHHFKELETYFRPGQNIGIEVKWKRVLKQLANDGRVSKAQDFGGKIWQEFRLLVRYRNGLVHGRSSRPASSGQPDELKPIPSPDDLDQLAPGWAVRIVLALLLDLHHSTGTVPPTWLVKP